MRIGIALVCLADLIIRVQDLTAHYTENGMWPARLIKNFGWYDGYWSIHALFDTNGWEVFVFTLHIISVICLLIGFKTRVSNLIVWLLYISLHNRNLFILQAGDDLLRICLFWGLLLPWQHEFSIDSLIKPSKKKQNLFANFGYLLLIASVYIFTVLLKSSNEWRSEGSAIYFALSLDQLRLPFTGDWLYQQPQLMKILTYIVYWIEILIPIFILLPSRKYPFRFIGFLLLLALHIGIGLTMYVGLFYLINIVTALALIPNSYLKWIRWFRKTKSPNSINKKKEIVYINTLRNSIIVIIIFLNLLINLSALSWFSYELATPLRMPLNALKFSQFWGMFSPSVLKQDGWFVYDGRDSQGRQYDMRLNQDYVDFKKPKHVVSMYKSDRWRKLAENMQNNNAFLRPLYCNYILNKWNEEHPDKKLAALNLYYMNETNLADYKTTIPQKVLYCYCTNEFFPSN
jgi:uncharacterized membrane protein YphA (DoxX/SURF4 family)